MSAMNGETAKESLKRKRSEADDLTDDDDQQPLVAPKPISRKKVLGSECPFLDTIARQNLDFDFEKCCSVSLSRVNVYACLVCGDYFQGRGPGTHAHTHSVEENHQLFMKLDSGAVFCLPDNYEVIDSSLKDIRHELNPLYTAEDIQRLDSVAWARTLDGSDYMPGLVGLNNMKRNDYLNVVVQALVRVRQLRNFFLNPANYEQCKSPLVQRFGELMRKIWNPRAFKGQVSPHEFMQAVIDASKRQFVPDVESDPVMFWTWLLNTLHSDLTGGKRKKRSIVTDCFQGQLEVTTLAGTGAAADKEEDVVVKVPFFTLALDLPPARLFQDQMEANIIQQVQIFELLSKYNGEKIQEDVQTGRRKFKIVALPRYLMLNVRRFTKNRFFVEKNPTIVNFPVKNLDLNVSCPYLKEAAKEASGAQNGKGGKAKVKSRSATYNLMSSVSHVGPERPAGVYRAYVHRAAENAWYEVQDLLIKESVPEAVVITECYFQVYEQQRA